MRNDTLQAEQLRAKLYDATLHLYTARYYLDALRELALGGPLELVYFHLPFLEPVEAVSGWERTDALHRDALSALRESVAGDGSACLLVDGVHADHLLLIRAAGGPPVRELTAALNRRLQAHHPESAHAAVAGAVSLTDQGDTRFERHFMRNLAIARVRALSAAAAAGSREIRHIEQILSDGAIRSLYQPIVRLEDGHIIGYEALSRGPAGTPQEHPEALFELAGLAGLTHRLDTLCHTRAVGVAPARLGGASLFVNASPLSFIHPDFSADRFAEPFLAAGFRPGSVVIELTERSGITDFSAFSRALKPVKAMGFRIAIDDVGSGYSSLQTISETEPEFIKIDRALVTGLDKTPIKREIVKNLARLGHSTRISVIAEGVEVESELRELTKIPVELAQGHYFAQPGDLVA